MKTIVVILLLFAVHSSAKAFPQDTIYKYVDTMPEFKGGEAALMKLLSDSTHYPVISKEDDIPSSRIIIEFVVNEDGHTSDFKVIRGSWDGFDKEIIRVIKTYSRFKPGMQNGKAVKVYYRVPVYLHFR